jgi:hypothetical protein
MDVKPSRKGILIEEKKRKVDKNGKIHLGPKYAFNYYVISWLADGSIKLVPTWEDKEND